MPKPRRSEEPSTVAASGRYTPKEPAYRIRPRWHRFAGWTGIAVGIVLAVTNDSMLFTDNDLLPFGHQEYYLSLALLIAGSSTWFLGLFDRGTTVYN